MRWMQAKPWHYTMVIICILWGLPPGLLASQGKFLWPLPMAEDGRTGGPLLIMAQREPGPPGTDTAINRTANQPPVANAGSEQVIVLGDPVQLDGRASTDPDNAPAALTWQWQVIEAPAESTLTEDDIRNATAARATFTPDVRGDFVLQLTVTDGAAQDTADVRVTVLNNLPVANAGTDRAVPANVDVRLDGSASFDPDGDLITFAWRFAATPPDSALADIHLAEITTPIPSFVPDVDGDFVLRLVVNDGQHDSAPALVTITVSTANVPPTANAGPDRTVRLGTVVRLDGSQSYDADAGPSLLTFRWTLAAVPADSKLRDRNIADITQPRAVFSPDVPGSYVLTLRVTDRQAQTADDVIITVVAGNTLLTAEAGEAHHVGLAEEVVLDGAAHTGPNAASQPLTYTWRFVTVPPGSTLTHASLSGAATVTPRFTPDVDGSYIVQLTVSNGLAEARDQVLVMVSTGNRPPRAEAGDEAQVPLGQEVQLTGATSSDPDAGPAALTFAWSLVAAPAGSTLTDSALLGATTDTPRFTPDVAGSYVLRLDVSDGLAQASDNVLLTVFANIAPVAHAGTDQQVVLGEEVALDGTASGDPDNKPAPLAFVWRVRSVPAGSALTSAGLRAANTRTPRFIPDVTGHYTLELIVSDGAAQHVDTVTVQVQAQPQAAPVERDWGGDLVLFGGLVLFLAYLSYTQLKKQHSRDDTRT